MAVLLVHLVGFPRKQPSTFSNVTGFQPTTLLKVESSMVFLVDIFKISRSSVNTSCTCEQLLLKGHDKFQIHLELLFRADLQTYAPQQKQNILH